MNRHERRRQEKEVRQRANSRGVEASSMVADQATADAFGAALALQQAGRLAEAEHAWENLRSTMPDHDGVNVNLATVLWRLGRLDDAFPGARSGALHEPANTYLWRVCLSCRRADDGGAAAQRWAVRAASRGGGTYPRQCARQADMGCDEARGRRGPHTCR